MRPGYDKMNFTVLTMLLNTTSGVQNQLPLPTWSGPDPSIVQVQSILYSSLASALLAALMASLGKQWLNFYVEGSFIDRNHHRELKMRGMITWHFKFIMECLPLIIHTSLLLFGYAMAQYLQELSRTVSSVIIGFIASGVTFYIFVVVAGTLSKTCPFQTPISVAIRATWEHYREAITEASKVIRNFNAVTRSRRSQQRLITYRQQDATLPTPPNAGYRDNEVRPELNCISTLLKISNAPDSIMAIMAYIPEIVWDENVKSVPLLQVYQKLRDSLQCSASGGVSPRQGARDIAFWSAKALLHLYVQRRCIHPEDLSLLNQARFIDHREQLGHRGSDKDDELASTLYIVDWTFSDRRLRPRIPWSELQLSDSHRCWLSRVLRYRARDTLRSGGELTDDVRGFVMESLSRRSPTRVIADCLFIINVVAGYEPESGDLSDRLELSDAFYTGADT